MRKYNIEIRTAMLKKGITQRELGKKMGVTRETVNSLLRFELPKDKKDEILAVIKEM